LHVGRIGKTTLKYDRVTGKYHEQLGIAAKQYEERGE